MSATSQNNENDDDDDATTNDSVRLLSLDTKDFEQALMEHVDESKPDPLLRRKMTNLKLEWENILDDDDDDGKMYPSSSESIQNHPTTTAICGILTLGGEYMNVLLQARCSWDIYCDTDGVLFSKMELDLYVVGANFKTFSQTQEVEDEKKKPMSRVDKKIQKKLLDGIRKRFQSDFYIKKIIHIDNSKTPSRGKSRNQTSSSSSSNNSKNRLFLCHAVIHQSVVAKHPIDTLSSSQSDSGDMLEERVDVSEDTVKGIQRIFFPCDNDETDAYLTVMEFLLSLPYLPRKPFLQRNKKIAETIITKLHLGENNNVLDDRQRESLHGLVPSLAERVSLRLLEDAMLDACEMEGNDDLLDDLHISKHKSNKKAREEE